MKSACYTDMTGSFKTLFFEFQPQASAVLGTRDTKVSKTGEISAPVKVKSRCEWADGPAINKQTRGPGLMVSALKKIRQVVQ